MTRSSEGRDYGSPVSVFRLELRSQGGKFRNVSKLQQLIMETRDTQNILENKTIYKNIFLSRSMKYDKIMNRSRHTSIITIIVA